MKRLALGAAMAALALTASPASAAVDSVVETYPVYCGYTVIYQCGLCVRAGSVTDCVYY